jgi:poly(hydroxyalkanoate) granule-associated protein
MRTGGVQMASKAEAEVIEEVVVEEPSILESLRRVLLASVGAVALTIEEIGDLVDKLVERGEIAEQEGKKLINEIKQKRMKKADEAEDMASTRMREMMDKMDIPTKSDIDDLSAKIATLSKKVDELKKAQSQG